MMRGRDQDTAVIEELMFVLFAHLGSAEPTLLQEQRLVRPITKNAGSDMTFAKVCNKDQSW